MSRVINCAPYLMHLFITSHYSVVHLMCFAINLPRSCLLYRHAPGTVIEDISNPFGCKNCNHERNNPQPTAAISLSSTIRQCTLWTVAGTLRTTLSIHLNTTPLKSSQHLTMLQSHGSDLFDFPSLFMHINIIYTHMYTCRKGFPQSMAYRMPRWTCVFKQETLHTFDASHARS